MTIIENPTHTFTFNPISRTDAQALRSLGGERYVADSKPGYPCRQCLRDAEIGEELILVSHDPFVTDSPYRARSPIFLHADDCGAPDDSPLPEQIAARHLSIRCFDDSAMMIDAVVVDGSGAPAVLERLLSLPGADVAHIHAAQRGCWLTAARRSRR